MNLTKNQKNLHLIAKSEKHLFGLSIPMIER